jgi:hypothetical protein
VAQQLEWSVKIVANPSGQGAAFQPNLVPEVPPGTSLSAQIGDIVTWRNDTDAEHQPCPTVGNVPDGPPDAAASGPTMLSGKIAAHASSTPQYVVNPAAFTPPISGTGTIYYCCLNHPGEPGERGSITIVTF